MKYIDAELLKTGLTRLGEEFPILTYEAVLYLINSLQQEQQEEPDKSLEEEIKNYFQGYFPGTETVEQCNTDLHFTPPAIIRLARHFAEWGAEHLCDSTKMIGKSLEEAAEEAVCMAFGGDPAYYGNKAEFSVNECIRLFIAGAEYQARQLLQGSPMPEDTVLFQKGVEEGKRLMMEDAMEVVVWDAGVDFAPHPVISIEDINVKDGDKVRIVVLKEE